LWVRAFSIIFISRIPFHSGPILQDNPKLGDPQWIRPSLPNMAAMRKQPIHLLAAVRGDRPAPCTAEEALEDLILAKDYIDFMNRPRSE
jgi:hypothetical protein